MQLWAPFVTDCETEMTITNKRAVVLLDSLVDEIIDRRGVTPKKLGSDFTTDGHRVISAKLIKENRIDWTADEPRYIDRQTYAKWMRTELRADDVLLTSEAPLGETAYIWRSVDWCLGQRLYAIRTKKEILHGRYLYYALRSDMVRQDLFSRETGTTVVGIRQSELRKVGIPLPPLSEQRAIADILGALDDKIELNRRMNATLEAMARALFQSWFVDFDPVRAKIEGRSPAEMDAATAALFPAALQESELGPIPAGWRVARLGEVFDLTMGQSPPSTTYNEDGVGLPFYQGSTDFGFRIPTRRIYCSEPTRTSQADDALISVRAPVGALNWCIETCCIGRGVAAVRSRERSPSFTFYTLESMRSMFEIYDGQGTVFGSISKTDFQRLPVMMPAGQVIREFERTANPLDVRIRENELESRRLASLRDTLLPKLLSGELAIDQAYEVQKPRVVGL
jgi:type I restriction enzyme S subunit